MTTTQTIVAFKIGRGGHYHNAGFLSFLGEEEIGHFTDDLFLNYENINDFKNRFGYDSTGSEQRCILDLICDEDFDELEEKFGIKMEDLGQKVYSDGGGNHVGLTEEEESSGIGRIDIDGEYNTIYTCYLADCDEKECRAILNCSGYVSEEILDHAKNILGIENQEKDY